MRYKSNRKKWKQKKKKGKKHEKLVKKKLNLISLFLSVEKGASASEGVKSKEVQKWM